jgi:flagellin
LNNISITVNTVSRSNVIQSINEKQGLTGVVASEYGQGIQLVAEDGRNIVIDIAASAISAGNIGLYGVTLGAGTGVTTSGVAHYSSVKLESDKAFRVERGNEGNSNFELLGFRVGTFGGRDTGTKIADVDVSSQLGAQTAISAIDSAIEDVASSQARSGAFQNRLEASVSVLSEAVENESAARGRILDTNYAEETTALAKAQIVQQAATAMLAQANQQSQSVLALLQ